MTTETSASPDSVQEILDRARRIETRLMRLCAAMGVDPTRDKARVTTLRLTPDQVLDVTGLDVSFGDILAFCRKSGIRGLCAVQCRGEIIGTVLIEEVANAGT
jgi:hypothetical protein